VIIKNILVTCNHNIFILKVITKLKITMKQQKTHLYVGSRQNLIIFQNGSYCEQFGKFYLIVLCMYFIAIKTVLIYLGRINFNITIFFFICVAK